MRVLRLATRSSHLALWQTDAVAHGLTQLGNVCEQVPIVSTGDIDLIKPIYALGVQGVFTKELDIALLSHQADVAVHSLKDIPIVLAKGLALAAVLERADHRDVVITKTSLSIVNTTNFMLATSSIRRQAQWLERYPNHSTANVRGNVETRIKKLETSTWNGLLMAKAALDRLALKLEFAEPLDWMLPAPGQGAIAVVCRQDDSNVLNICKQLNHPTTWCAVNAERVFLHTLKGGCSAPMSALATVADGKIHLSGAVHSLNGKQAIRVEATRDADAWKKAGQDCAQQVLASNAGQKILADIFSTKQFLSHD